MEAVDKESDMEPQFLSAVTSHNVGRVTALMRINEAAVKTVKHMMYKCLQDGTDVYEALLELRNTPQQDTGLSSTQLMFGRLTRTRLPAVTNRPVNKKQSAMAQKSRTRRQQTVRQSYNRRVRDLFHSKPDNQCTTRTSRDRGGERGRSKARRMNDPTS